MHPQALLDACSDLVRLTLRFEHPADAVVSRFFREHRGLGPRERATLTDTAFAVLRKKLLYEHVAASGSGSRERRLAILGFQGPQELLDAALNEQERRWLEACREIDPADLMERHRHNLPDWLAEALKEQLGIGFWPLVQALDAGAGLDLRVNTLKGKRASLQEELARAGITAVPTPYSPWGLRIAGKPALHRLDAFTRGAFEVQNEGSQLIALLMEASRGEMVVDFCAGAGGKTLALGASMRSTGRLYAFDTSAHRLAAFKPRQARSGLSNVHPVAIAHERDDRIQRLAGKIDRVLVDAPCSGLGTLGRSPDLKWRHDMKSIIKMAQTQSAILDKAARLVKPGGRLVYATCSLLQQENEVVAEAFSAANRAFRPLDVAQIMTTLTVPEAGSLCSSGGNGTRNMRLWPHMHHTDGFFAAVWQRDKES